MVSKDSLIQILDFLDKLNIRYWLDGGWGVDVLYGKQTREHRDVDIDFDSRYTHTLLTALADFGYAMVTDELPVRAELFHSKYGYIDIHPFEILEDGRIRQASPDGGYFDFESEWFGEAWFEGKRIPCISLEGQKIFHSGYELRETDIHDLRILDEIKSTI